MLDVVLPQGTTVHSPGETSRTVSGSIRDSRSDETARLLAGLTVVTGQASAGALVAKDVRSVRRDDRSLPLVSADKTSAFPELKPTTVMTGVPWVASYWTGDAQAWRGVLALLVSTETSNGVVVKDVQFAVLSKESTVRDAQGASVDMMSLAERYDVKDFQAVARLAESDGAVYLIALDEAE
jgi:hypothetical protein